jgi:hypothetical protein
LNLVQRIDIRISELPENQVIGVQLRHERLNLSQVWYMTRPPALESLSLEILVRGATTEQFLRTNVERGIEPVRQIHSRAGKCAQSNEHKNLDDLPADGDVAVSVARSSGSIRSLPRLSERCVSINMGELRDSGRKCGLLSTVRYEHRRGTRRIEERIQPDYVGGCGLHRLARSSHI